MSNNALGYDQVLPESIRGIFKSVYEDVVWLQCKWDFYIGLFSSRENTDLLSDLAQTSFKIIEESLRADMTMTICRLGDPSRSTIKGKTFDNLSLETLIERCDKVKNVTSLLQDFRSASKPVRDYRNKGVGHNDLNTSIRPTDNPLPGISRSQIDKTLKLAWQILNVIYQHFVPDTELGAGVRVISGADTLIYWLKLAHEYRNKGIK
jgi:hypothetical protein